VTDATKNPDEQDLNQFKSPIDPLRQQNPSNNNTDFNSGSNVQNNANVIQNQEEDG